MKPLPSSFFNRPTVDVATDLLGCILVRRIPACGDRPSRIKRYLITETEAYDGPHDLACHASKGRTKRTEIMFGPAGHAYVYFVYGIHWMLNIVTGPREYPAAVLIRAAQSERTSESFLGPAVLTRALGITGRLNGARLGRANDLWIEPRRMSVHPHLIKRASRIGVEYAGAVWARKKWRFVLASSRASSP